MKPPRRRALSLLFGILLTVFCAASLAPTADSQGAAQSSLFGFDIQPGAPASQATGLRSSGGALYFLASEVPFIRELWRVGVAGAGPVLVAVPLTQGTAATSPFGLTDVGGTVFFAASEFASPSSGRELWKTDGTVSGTILVADIATQPNSSISSTPNHLVEFGGLLFFTADDNVNGRELWKSDGTSGGTVMVADIQSGAGDAFPNSNLPVLPTEVNGTLFFFADNGTVGRELWKTDGTAAGTSLVADINTGGSSGPFPLNPGGQLEDSFTGVSLNNELFFLADDGQLGVELWKSDGMSATMVRDILVGPSSGGLGIASTGLVELNGFLYFSPIGAQLWRTDGTTAGTTMVASFGGSVLSDLIVFQGKLIFSTSFGAGPDQLRSTDGTSFEVLGNLTAASFRQVNGLLMFVADDGVFGSEVWQTDGTAAGTVLAADVFLNGDSFPRELTVVDGSLFFIADDEVIGREPHVLTAPKPDPSSGSASNLRFAGTSVDPVNTFSGELFTEVVVDLDLGGPLPLAFTRYYASYLKRNRVEGDLGNNWRHNFDASMTRAGNSALYISAKGRVTSFSLSAGDWTQLDNLDTPYQLNLDAGMDAVLFDPTLERILTFDFTSGGAVEGKLTQVEDGTSNLHALSYDGGSGQLISVADGLGRTLTFTYNADALPKIAQVTDGVRTVTYTYTDGLDSENLSEVIDAAGGMTTFVYANTSGSPDSGLMLSKQRPELNVPFTQTYFGAGSSEGRVERQLDAAGNATSFDYQGANTVITHPTMNTRIHSHSGGALTGITDQVGSQFTMGSDGAGRRSSLTDRSGRVTSTSFDVISGKTATVVEADGATTALQFTSRMVGAVEFRDPTRITMTDGTVNDVSRDAAGNATTATDALGNQRSATFNGRGQVLTVTNALGGVVTNVYGADGTLASETDSSGNLTSFGYDALRRRTLVTFADGATRSFAFDAFDRRTAATDSSGNTATFGYDGNGNLTALTDRTGSLITIGYDANDRPTSFLDSLGNTTLRSYDLMGRVDRRTDANGNATQLSYDSLQRVSSVTLPGGEVAALEYDAEGLLTRRTDPLGNSTTFLSDALGRITSTTSPLGFVRSIAYDSLGRTSSATDALGQVTTFTRDARGLLTGITLPGFSNSVAYERDALGGVTKITDPGGSEWLRSYESSGRRSSTTDPLGRTTTWAYDSRNRLSLLTYPGTLGTVGLSYDASGNLTRASASAGAPIDTSYDAEDRPISGTGWTKGLDALGRVIESNGIGITRDAGGRMLTVGLAVGRTLTYAYDANNRLTSVTDWNGATTSFAYDAAGRRTSLVRPSGLITTESWDADGRLMGISEGTLSSILLTRDGSGQVTQATRNLPEVPSAQMQTSVVTSFNAAGEQIGSTYDELGRLLNRGAASFGWNLFSRLTSYDLGGSAVTASYDGAGRRISRTESGTTRGYVWNLALELDSVSIERESGMDVRYFVHTPSGELLYSIDATTGARTFYHFDEGGNTVFLSDDTGLVIASYAHSPYGRLLSTTGTVDNPFTWQGKFGVMDEGLGIYYIRARYYDSGDGRFLSRDSAGSVGPLSVNPYLYGYSNPLLFIDPTGQTPTKVNQPERTRLNAMGRPSDALATHGVQFSRRALRRIFDNRQPTSPLEIAERAFVLGIPEVVELFANTRESIDEERAAFSPSPVDLFIRVLFQDPSPPSTSDPADALIRGALLDVLLILNARPSLNSVDPSASSGSNSGGDSEVFQAAEVLNPVVVLV